VRAKVGPKVPVGVRISQGKVNDYDHKWSGAERDAEIIFGSLADAGADFIHVTEYEAWKPAFPSGGPSLMQLAKRYAPEAAIFTNGSLHNVEQAVAALDEGADIVTIGRGALANPDFPKRLSGRGILNDFDPTILGPIANIKETELVL
jgi:2,4-dienoyl-CoA reductase-like NADH-dependent reductase (Old Yellow Enzyme family)